jgi:hypothetical protein
MFETTKSCLASGCSAIWTLAIVKKTVVCPVESIFLNHSEQNVKKAEKHPDWLPLIVY